MVKGEFRCMFVLLYTVVSGRQNATNKGNFEYMISKENIGHIRKILRGLDRLLACIILKSKIFFNTYIEELFLLYIVIICTTKFADDSSNVSLSLTWTYVLSP